MASASTPTNGLFQSTPSGGKATGHVDYVDLGSRFQSTPSGGKATIFVGSRRHGIDVSIHAFRGEGDLFPMLRDSRLSSFNPRLPGGRRLAPTYKLMLPVWVSIHAFRGEGDVSIRFLAFTSTAFQSTPSGGKATHTAARSR